MIDCYEDNDRHGVWIVRGGGKSARSIPELAKALGVPEEKLRLHLNPNLGRPRGPRVIQADTDYNVFDPKITELQGSPLQGGHRVR